MSANTWYAISLVGYFAALIGLIVTIVLYIRLDILDVIGDLTGRTVAKELKSMRENRGTRSSANGSRARKLSGSAKSAKKTGSGRQQSRRTGGRTTGRTGGAATVQPAGFAARKAKNGTAEMGSGYQAAQPDKRVLHSKTDKLSRETEELYEDFDPRQEYSRTEILEETSEKPKSGGTAVLKSGTEVLKSGTEVLKSGTEVLTEEGSADKRRGTEVLKPGTVLLEGSASGGTTLLVEEEQVEPVKFSVTRSYLIVHSEEKIL